MCVLSGIGNCEVVYLAWGLSLSACFEDFGSCYLGGWRCGMITMFGAFGSWRGNGSCSLYLMDGSFSTGEGFYKKECLLGMFSRCSGFGGAYGGIGVSWVAGGVGVKEAWKLASACLPPGQFWMEDLVCWAGVSCIVHAW